MSKLLTAIAILVILGIAADAEALNYDRLYFFGLQQRYVWDEGKSELMASLKSGCDKAAEQGFYRHYCLFAPVNPVFGELREVEKELSAAQGRFGQAMTQWIIAPGAESGKLVEKEARELTLQIVKALEWLARRGIIFEQDKGWRFVKNKFVSE